MNFGSIWTGNPSLTDSTDSTDCTDCSLLTLGMQFWLTLLAVLVILAIQLFAIQQCSIGSTELCELVLLGGTSSILRTFLGGTIQKKHPVDSISGSDMTSALGLVNTFRMFKRKRIWENCDWTAIGNQALVLKECGHLTWMEPLRFLSVCEYKDIHYQNSSINRASF